MRHPQQSEPSARRRLSGRRSISTAAAVAVISGAMSGSAPGASVEFIGRNFAAGNTFTVPMEASGTPVGFLLGTYSAAGGTTPLGFPVSAGGMDSFLNLFSGTATLIAQHDDLNPATNLDSEIRSNTYSDVTRAGGVVASALAAGPYSVRLSRFNSGSDAWSLAIANTTGTLSLRNPTFTGTPTLEVIQVGGRLTLDTGAYSVNSRVTVTPGGQLTLGGGVALTSTLQVNGNVTHGRASVIAGGGLNIGDVGSTIGRYTLNDPLGDLNAVNILMGIASNATAEFSQLGGSVTTTALILGNAFATNERSHYLITAGTLTANYIDADPSSDNMLDIQGGTVSIALANISDLKLGDTLTWGSGTLEFTTPFVQLELRNVLGDEVSLTSARRLKVGGSDNWNTLIKLDGGTLSANAINAAAPLEWNSGTIEFTAPALFGPTRGLGALVTLSSGKTITGTTGTIESSGMMLVQPGGRLAMTTVNNIGNLVLGGAGALVDAASVNNSGTLSGGGLIRGQLTNMGSASIPLAAADALRVEGNIINSGQVRLTGGSLSSTANLNNLAGGTITGRGTVAANVLANAGTATFSGGTSDLDAGLSNQSGGKVIVTGAGTLTVHRGVTNSAGSEFRVSQNSHAVFLGNVIGLSAFTGVGTKYFEAGASGGSLLSGTGASVVEAGGNLVTAGIRETSLIVRGPAALTASSPTSRVNTLGFEGGTLDLNNNHLIVDYAALSPNAAIRQAIIDGDLASTAPTTGNRAIGYADNAILAATTFGGLGVDATSVLVRWTVRGDANLDGSVNFTDLVRIAQNYNASGREWVHGDFNYDGSVGFADLVVLAQNYNAAVSISAIESIDANFAADWALAQSLVPEPTFAATLAICAMTLRRRR